MSNFAKSFEELVVWKESINIAKGIYDRTGSIVDFGFRDQIRKSIISVSSNIAEGFDRGSHQEFKSS